MVLSILGVQKTGFCRLQALRNDKRLVRAQSACERRSSATDGVAAVLCTTDARARRWPADRVCADCEAAHLSEIEPTEKEKMTKFQALECNPVILSKVARQERSTRRATWRARQREERDLLHHGGRQLAVGHARARRRDDEADGGPPLRRYQGPGSVFLLALAERRALADDDPMGPRLHRPRQSPRAAARRVARGAARAGATPLGERADRRRRRTSGGSPRRTCSSRACASSPGCGCCSTTARGSPVAAQQPDEFLHAWEHGYENSAEIVLVE